MAYINIIGFHYKWALSKRFLCSCTGKQLKLSCVVIAHTLRWCFFTDVFPCTHWKSHLNSGHNYSWLYFVHSKADTADKTSLFIRSVTTPQAALPEWRDIHQHLAPLSPRRRPPLCLRRSAMQTALRELNTAPWICLMALTWMANHYWFSSLRSWPWARTAEATITSWPIWWVSPTSLSSLWESKRTRFSQEAMYRKNSNSKRNLWVCALYCRYVSVWCCCSCCSCYLTPIWKKLFLNDEKSLYD